MGIFDFFKKNKNIENDNEVIWVCKKCKEEIEDTFDCCWNCQTSRVVKKRQDKKLSKNESIKLQQYLKDIRKVNLKIKEYLELLNETDPQKFQLGFLIKKYLKSPFSSGLNSYQITFDIEEKNLTLNYLLKKLENHKKIIEERNKIIPNSDINIGNNDEIFNLNNIKISEICDCCICKEEKSNYYFEDSEENMIFDEMVMNFLINKRVN